MRIFSLDNGLKLTEITEYQFTTERHIQTLVESNLQTIFTLMIVRSEFELHGFRIDTLAFDKESKAFVIIEYKKDRNFSVVDQGIAYLNLMLNNKADFILEYNEKAVNISATPLKRQDVDWSQSRVIFVAPEFTKYQQHAIGFKDLAIQLYEIHKYANGLIVLNEVKPPERKESISTVTRGVSPEVKRISEEIKVYNEEDLLNIADDHIKDLYYELKSTILKIGSDIEVRPTKMYIAFRRKAGFVGVVVLRSKLKTYLNAKVSELDDPMKKARDVKKIGHYSHGDTEVTINNSGEIPYVLELIKQAYQRN